MRIFLFFAAICFFISSSLVLFESDCESGWLSIRDQVKRDFGVTYSNSHDLYESHFAPPPKIRSTLVEDNQPSVLGQHVIYFDYERTVYNNNCRLNPNSFSWIGAGYDGPVFTAEFDCADGARQKWALKLKAPRHNTTHGIIEVPGLNQKKIQHPQRVYKHFIGQGVSKQKRDDALDHFAVVVGTVNITYNAMAEQFRNLALQKGSIQYDMQTDDKQDIIAAVMPILNGQVLGELQAGTEHAFSVSERRHILRDLVWMYGHMFDRNVVHCDIWLRHFMLLNQTQKVALFDFDRVWFLDNKKAAVAKQEERRKRGNALMRKRQLMQILNFAGIACNRNPRDSRKNIKVEINVCSYEEPMAKDKPKEKGYLTSQEHLTLLNPIFANCGHLFPGQLQFEAAELETPTKAFEKLKSWVAGTGRLAEHSKVQ